VNKKVNSKDWFLWEQIARPMWNRVYHDLAFTNTRDYLGFTYVPATLMVYEQNDSGDYIGKMFIRHCDIQAVGQKKIDILMCPKYRAEFDNEIAASEKALLDYAEKIFYGIYTLEQALDCFYDFQKVMGKYYKHAWFYAVTPYRAETLLLNYIKDKADLSALLTTDEPSFEHDILTSLRDCCAGKVTSEQHSKKYHWCKNNYFETRFFSPQDVAKEISEHDYEYYDNLIKTSDKSRAELLKRKAKVLSALPTYYQKLVDITNVYATKLMDDRKRVIMTCQSSIDKLFEVVAKETNTPLSDLHLLLPQELRYFTKNTKSYRQRIEERKKLFIVLQHEFPILDELIEPMGKIPFMSDPYIAEGDQAIKALENINQRMNIFDSSGSQNNTLQGMVTYSDKDELIGIVRVIRNSNNMQISNGEILVATSTTPDYLTAMHKSSAIITDYGGLTSHAAIVSRELKKPCIIGTNSATSVLKTGQRIRMNFVDGTITILQSEVSK